MMGIVVPKTCWACKKFNKITVASSWFTILQLSVLVILWVSNNRHFLTYLITLSCFRISFMWSLVSVGYKACNCVVRWHRNSEKSQRSQLDLCVVVFRTRSPASPEVGRLVEHSKRQVRGFVGCHKMLERDLYILVCLAFNHWHTGKLHLQTHNSSVLFCPTVDLTDNTQMHYET